MYNFIDHPTDHWPSNGASVFFFVGWAGFLAPVPEVADFGVDWVCCCFGCYFFGCCGCCFCCWVEAGFLAWGSLFCDSDLF